MIFGLFLYSIATLLCGFSNNIIQLGLAQFFAGIGGSTYHPIGIPLVSLSSSKKKIGQAQGIHQAGGAIGSFIAPLLAAYIGVAFDWRFSFIFLSLFRNPDKIITPLYTSYDFILILTHTMLALWRQN